jgi:hypothetical protein
MFVARKDASNKSFVHMLPLIIFWVVMLSYLIGDMVDKSLRTCDV